MKKLDLTFTILQVPLDYLMLILAGIVSYWSRYQSFVTQVRPVFFDVDFFAFLELLAWVGLVGLIVFAWLGLYKVRTSLHKATEFKNVFFAVSTTLLIVIIGIFLQRELFSSRYIILLAWILAVLFTFLARVFLFKIKTVILKNGYGSYHVLVIGDNNEIAIIKDYYQKNQYLAREVVATIDNYQDIETQMINLHQTLHLDEVIQADDNLSKDDISVIVNFCNDNHITLKFIAGIYQTKAINFDVGTLAGFPIVTLRRTPLDGWGRIIKRIFDFSISLIGLIVLSPIFLVIAIIIILDSPGPALIKLQRIGQYGRPFDIYKFRSMVKNAASMKNEIQAFNERSDGPLFKMHNDPRITRVGRILRKSSLDELPQLVNVLIGNMSLVGPRPHEPQEVSRYQRDYKKLLTIKPGITGAAQVSGRSKLQFDDEAKLDIYYIENWSMAEDLKILAKTPKAILDFKDVS